MEVGAYVYLYGTVFYPNMPITITINGIQATNVYTSEGSASAKVPIGATTGKIVVKTNGREFSFANKAFIWARIASVPGNYRYAHSSFVLNGVPYTGLGNAYDNRYQQDFWQYNINNNTWSSKAELTNLVSISEGYTGFAVNGKGYFLGGNQTALALWEYTPTNNTWAKKNGFTTLPRYSMVSIVCNNRVYAGMGRNNASIGYTAYKDFWEYNTTNNSWTKKTDLPGVGRFDAATVALGTKLYVGCGFNNTGAVLYDWWEYDTVTDVWTKKANTTVQMNNVLNVNGKIYGLSYNDTLYEYNPTQDTWTFITNTIASANTPYTKAVSIDNTMYFISGTSGWKVNL
jgi:hypothetical protein